MEREKPNAKTESSATDSATSAAARRQGGRRGGIRNAALKIAALSVVILFFAVVVLGAAGLSAESRVFPSDITLNEQPIRYSSALTKRFYTAFRLFFLTDDVESPLFEWLIDDIYNALSAARIPSEKVVWLLEQVETIRAEENPAYLWILEKQTVYQELLAEYEAGKLDKKPRFEDVVSVSEARTAIAGVFGFVVSSPLTNDELGRLIYRSAVLYAGDPDYTALLKTIGEKDVSMLTVGSYRVYLTTENFLAAGSVAAARGAGQSLVALGSSYLSLYKKIGMEGADRLFGLDFRMPDAEDGWIEQELVPYYNRQMDAIEGLAGGALLLAGEVLTALTDTLFEELYFSDLASAEGNAKEAAAHKIAAASALSRAIRTGLDNAKLKSEKLFLTDAEAIALFSEGYAASYRLKAIYDGDGKTAKDDDLIGRYRNAAAETLQTTLYAADRLSLFDRREETTLYGAAIALLEKDPAAFDRYLADAESVLSADLSSAEVLKELLTSLVFNAVIRYFETA